MTLSLSQIKEPSPMKTASGDREAMKKQRTEDSKMVKVTYINTKGSKLPFELPYCMWDGDPILTYKFLPDNDYDIPKGLVDLVNKKRIRKQSGLLDKSGKELMQDSMEPYEHRFVAAGM